MSEKESESPLDKLIAKVEKESFIERVVSDLVFADEAAPQSSAFLHARKTDYI